MWDMGVSVRGLHGGVREVSERRRDGLGGAGWRVLRWAQGVGYLGCCRFLEPPRGVKPTPVGCPHKPVVLEAQDELLNGPGSPLALFFLGVQY